MVAADAIAQASDLSYVEQPLDLLPDALLSAAEATLHCGVLVSRQTLQIARVVILIRIQRLRHTGLSLSLLRFCRLRFPCWRRQILIGDTEFFQCQKGFLR